VTDSAWRTEPAWGVADQVRERLARTATDVARDWGLTLAPGGGGRYSYVGFTSDDSVLKVTPIEDDEANYEADALALWNGDGAVRLLRSDPARRALLIHRARPGTDLSALPEDEANAAAVAVARRLWRPAKRGDPFLSIGERAARDLEHLDDTHSLVPVARSLFATMSFAETTLLHGDYHHYNVLRSGNGYLAIDPKPLVGEPEFDVPPFLWNPHGELPSLGRTERRIAAFAAAGLDPKRIREWAIVRGVCLGLPLSADETEETSPQLRTVRQLL
jgi:streptomycin 6-kinase